MERVSNFEKCSKTPVISLIELYNDGRHNVLVRKRGEGVTNLFFTCALIIPLENGDIHHFVTRAVKELIGNPQTNVQIPLLIDQEFKFLQSRIRIMHQAGGPCNCSEIIDQLLETDTIDSYQDLFEYTERLRGSFEEHPDFVCNSNLKTQIIATIPHMKCYGPEYQERIQSIALEEGQAFIAYEYYDEDEGIYRIHTLGDTGDLVEKFPAFDLSRALLQHGVLEAADALDPGNYKAKTLFY
jgi:hypothetical protein